MWPTMKSLRLPRPKEEINLFYNILILLAVVWNVGQFHWTTAKTLNEVIEVILL